MPDAKGSNFLLKMLKKLPDNYNKEEAEGSGKGSNIRTLFSIVASKFNQLESTVNLIELYKDIDEAQGATLDLIGQDAGQARNGASDPFYRILIKARMARNLSTADVNTIIRALAITLSCPYEEIYISEVSDKGVRLPASIAKVEFPLDSMQDAGMTSEEMKQLLKQIIAGGVNIEEIWLRGSFAFSDVYNEPESSQYGFAVVAQTVGGTLGYRYDE